MKAQHKTTQNSKPNPMFAQPAKEIEDNRMEIYRMIYFLNKIEGPSLGDLFGKFKIKFTDTDKASLKTRRNQNLSTNIPSLN